MRILFTRFPLESAIGGAEIQTISLMEGMRKRGHSVAFAGSCPVLLRLCKERNIPAIELRIGPPPVTKWNALSFIWRKARMKRALLELLDGFREPSAIVMLSMSEKLLLTDAAATRGINVLWVEHDRVGRWLTGNPWLPRLRALSKKATTVVVSGLSRKIYLGLGWNPDHTVAIPNGIDLQRFDVRPSPAGRGVGGEGILRLGCISRLSPEKGVDVLIRAMSGLPKTQLDIVGAGREEANLRMLAKDNPGIRFLGHVDDLGAFYRSIAALVLPSRDHDPFGLVAAEAMVLGLPVVVTDACGIAEYLKDGETALIAKANDSTSLQTALDRLKDAGLRQSIGEKGKKLAQELFSSERMTNEYENLLGRQ
jgi:glycosyltransferase involved in cell wall biosynthesis